jgi:hypothetical protein
MYNVYNAFVHQLVEQYIFASHVHGMENYKFRIIFDFVQQNWERRDKKFFHTEIGWLSRRSVLSRHFELRLEVQIVLSDSPSGFSWRFADEIWLFLLACVAVYFVV